MAPRSTSSAGPRGTRTARACASRASSTANSPSPAAALLRAILGAPSPPAWAPTAAPGAHPAAPPSSAWRPPNEKGRREAGPSLEHRCRGLLQQRQRPGRPDVGVAHLVDVLEAHVVAQRDQEL